MLVSEKVTKPTQVSTFDPFHPPTATFTFSNMSAQQPQKKRARGLAAASSSKSKKSKTEIDEEHGIENPSETWADLVELWENAFDGLSGAWPVS